SRVTLRDRREQPTIRPIPDGHDARAASAAHRPAHPARRARHGDAGGVSVNDRLLRPAGCDRWSWPRGWSWVWRAAAIAGDRWIVGGGGGEEGGGRAGRDGG